MTEGLNRGRYLVASWRNASGEAVGTTWGGTVCWFPTKGGLLRAVRKGYAHIIRCGECPGCLEFDRRRLAKRLQAKYCETPAAKPENGGAAPSQLAPQTPHKCGALYLVRIYVPVDDHAAVAHAMHRRKHLQLEAGWFRLGTTSIGVIARRKCSSLLRWRGETLKCRVEPIRLNRRLRAWRAITGGMLVDRKAYGANLNRYYVAGLPAAERESWEVIRMKPYQSYKRGTSPRAWRDGNVVLVPPEIFQLRRNDRRAVRSMMAQAHSPEGVAKVQELLARVGLASSSLLLPSKPAEGRLTQLQVKQWYADMAARKAARASAPPSILKSPSPSEGGSYISSEHFSGAAPPGIDPAEARLREFEPWTPLHIAAIPDDGLSTLTHKQWLHRRERRKLDDHLAALHARMKERK